ncbi:erythrocyte membrane protein 1, PfEMP1, putative [Plasmodium reichenowi]|uniref:Erythrocyte membrane protein 1, PfEMP1, putative n=1 Tax=Plasmodium reichenowi TaxID=5854 RepID=A0A2P9D7K1_PLARE|nr:erythrocyte membrane protein 1, PfEMP1, putative [Plasmodium reichenowi]
MVTTKPSAAQGGGGAGGDKVKEKDAKHVLDEIGEKVYKEVKSEADGTAKKYIDELKGNLKEAKGIRELVSSLDPCNLVEQYYEHVNDDGKRHPCGNETGTGDAKKEERFSDTVGGQCTNEKIKGNKYGKGKDCGACAPFRRLHLCNHNLETIETIKDTTSTTTDTFLAEVCMAAKHEGDSIRGDHDKYKETNNDSQLCTVLARSFADIGDIIRGKDLFHGNEQEKKQTKQLDDKLKDIFRNIYDELTNDKKSRYEGDTTEFFKLREDWWTANRETVWKAITCKADHGNRYFRQTCNDDGTPSNAIHKCRCMNKIGKNETDQVPTYFDYVPQFLRWFEEWAEDFCRLRKHKLENAMKKCRQNDSNGKERYCDLNRHDCVQTIRGNHVFVEDDECHKCSVACANFVKWIDNQKQEFLKQKKKYTSEISDGGSGVSMQRRRARSISRDDNAYEKKFYKLLKDGYQSVEAFLGLLNNETTCTKKLNENDEEEGTIDFQNVNSGDSGVGAGGSAGAPGDSVGDESNKTFYRTKYCEACPWCGAHKDNSKKGKWKDNKLNCAKTKTYKKENTTTIEILTPDKEQSDIVKKYKKFCDSVKDIANGGATGEKGENGQKGKNGNHIETWKCYYDENKDNKYVSGAINFCVLQNDDTGTSKENSMHYNSFFWLWVYHMLHDSVDWRRELGSCINKDNGNICKNKYCKGNCKCFGKWAAQKKTEWRKIKEHFDKQKNIPYECYFTTLEMLLKKEELLENIKDSYVNEEDKKRIEGLLKDEEAALIGGNGFGGAAGTPGCDGEGVTDKNTSIDKLLDHELNDANRCKNCQPRKVKNPCSGEKSDKKKYDVVATKVAYQMQQKAHEKMKENSVKSGERNSSLVGNIKNAKFNNGVNGNTLKEACDITYKHTNDIRGTPADGPCEGKGEGFDIGTTWNGRKSESNPPNVYIRPRRQHMCTSNLEKINYNWVIQNAKDHVNDTFLGNVLLAAKSEAQKIKNVYDKNKVNNGQNEKNGLNNEKTVCRAMKSSFADIGDIIKGTDLWDANGGEQTTQGNLVQIFKEIKDEIIKQHSGIKEKYKDNSKYLDLRKDWWEANRDQVWKAMKCGDKNPCSGESGTPYDDYIPQRLRWMTEWAEWYCKYQSQEYKKLEKGCSKCKGNVGGQCKEDTPGCTECKTACSTYTEKIQKWKPQWQPMQMAYTLLYAYAGKSDGIGLFGYPDQQEVLAFFKELKEEYDKTATSASSTKGLPTTTPNTPYATAAGYIHQEIGNAACDTQTQFCENENGVSRNTDGAKVKTNGNYVFRSKPNDYDDACKCKENTAPSNPGRALDPVPDSPPRRDVDEHDSADEFFEEEEEEIEEEPTTEEVTEIQETTPKAEGEPKVDVCGIVKTLFTSDDKKYLEEACKQKYSGNNSRLGWRCIPTNTNSDTSTTGDVGSVAGKGSETARAGRQARSPPEPAKSSSSNSGAICIPPRRRKLYVGKLTQWADGVLKSQKDGTRDGVSGEGKGGGGESSEAVSGKGVGGSGVGDSHAEGTSGEASSTSDQNISDSEKLRNAFIESAAIETFFLWDRYKKIKEKEKKEKDEAGPDALVVGTSSEPDELHKKLKEGEIPEDFKRQMFYTLGDYRDILFGDTKIVEYAVSGTGNKSGNEVMDEIESKINSILPKNGKPGQQTDSDKKQREEFWGKYAKYIWEGMICSLTYDTDSNKDQIEKIKDADGGVKLFQKLKTGNEYNKVTFNGGFDMDDTYGRAKGRTEAPNSGKTTKTELDNFVKRPFFFRWLEEWADEFCRKQKHKLDIIRVDCRGKTGDDKTCSGDGLRCDEEVPEKKEIFKPFNCSTCARHCRWYKKWIKTKRTEYEKLKGRYTNEISSVESNNDDNGFYTKLKDECTTAGQFLDNLKGEPCKNNENGKNDINFGDVNGETFKHTKDCGTCPEFKVKCNGQVCSGGGGKTLTCNGGKISASDIKNGVDSAKDLDMRVSDSNTTRFGDLNECEGAGIFQGIRKDEWKCGKVCGVDICTLGKDKNGKVYEHITVKEFVKRWLETFFDDYNRIQKKLNTCKENGKGLTCIKGCVDQWIKEKGKEWKNINEKYINKYIKENDDSGNTLSSFLEQNPFHDEVLKAIKPCKQISHFEKSKKCNNTANSKKSEDDTKYDGILCLLDKLSKKCEEDHTNSVQTSQTGGVNPETCGENSTLVGDDDPLEEEEDPDPNQNPLGKHPTFCKIEEKKEVREEAEDECKPDTVIPSSQTETTSVTDDSAKPNEEEVALPQEPSTPSSENPEEKTKSEEESHNNDVEEVKPKSKPAPTTPKDTKPLAPKDKKPKPVEESPYLKPALVSNALMWSVGIGFTALSYWWLLKKKIRRPVDLLSVLQIPQNDYGMPTKLSSNRYIPYASGKYRGKRYIYIEGDSSGDEKYAFMSDTTDITSSESEYEEFDINDIYAPGSPKYKTLIEVVLEPSKRDTQNDIPSDNTTPNSDIPNTRSDTPNTPSDIPNTPSGNTPPTSDIPNTPSDIPPPITDEEWNQLKKDFISNMLQNEQNDVPNDYTSGTTPTNTNNTTMSRHNVDNNTHPTPSHNKLDQKPFIMSIHDRNLLSGEEYNYDMTTNSGENDLYSGQNNLYSDVDSTSGNLGSYSDNHDSLSDNHHPYSGIDLINDALSGGNHDIYDELLKRKENELFGTNHNPKRTTINRFSKPARDDALLNQLNLFHKWLDRQRHMCEQWDKNKKEELLDKLKVEWENETHSGNINNGIGSGNHVLNTDVSIQINMNDPNPINQFTNMDTNPDNFIKDTILNNLEKYNEPYYYDFYEDDIYYNVNDDKTSVDHINMDYNKMDNNNLDVPTKVQIEMNIVNNKKEIFEEEYPMSDIWNI